MKKILSQLKELFTSIFVYFKVDPVEKKLAQCNEDKDLDDH